MRIVEDESSDEQRIYRSTEHGRSIRDNERENIEPDGRREDVYNNISKSNLFSDENRISNKKQGRVDDRTLLEENEEVSFFDLKDEKILNYIENEHFKDSYSLDIYVYKDNYKDFSEKFSFLKEYKFNDGNDITNYNPFNDEKEKEELGYDFDLINLHFRKTPGGELAVNYNTADSLVNSDKFKDYNSVLFDLSKKSIR